MNTMNLTCGVALHLQAVQETILQDLMLEFGDMGLVRQPERILQLSGERQIRALAATGKLFTYCAGWGVTTNPPDEANELMELMGRDTAVSKPRLHRADWVRTITTQEERGELIGRVMALTFQKEPPAATAVSAAVIAAVPTADEQAAQIARLEAQLAALRNGTAPASAGAHKVSEG
jgi:hypothetical protein